MVDRRGVVAEVRRPAELADLYARHPEVHPYGLADLEEPLWSRSTWYRSGDAAVGVLDLGSGAPVLYAVAADPASDRATLDLLDALAPDLPEHFVVTGPLGLAERLGPTHVADWVIPHVKLHLPDDRALPPADPRVTWLDRDAADEVVALRQTGGDASAFFIPSLLDTGHYGAVRIGQDLAAVAGVHVLSERYGVAAIGNVLTHPARRRQGLARALVATLARRLLDTVAVVGLNVGTANTGARALYHDLGFVPAVIYEEAELRRVH